MALLHSEETIAEAVGRRPLLQGPWTSAHGSRSSAIGIARSCGVAVLHWRDAGRDAREAGGSMIAKSRGGVGVAARLASRLGLFYGWLIVAVVLLVSMVTAGTRMASGVIIKPLEGEFGWDRATISLALAIGLLANGFGAPFGGKLIDRFGPQRVVIGSLIVTIVATVATILMHSI